MEGGKGGRDSVCFYREKRVLIRAYEREGEGEPLREKRGRKRGKDTTDGQEETISLTCEIR